MVDIGDRERTMVSLTNRNDCISGTCRSCSESVSIMVNGQDVVDWEGGKYIQDADRKSVV